MEAEETFLLWFQRVPALKSNFLYYNKMDWSPGGSLLHLSLYCNEKWAISYRCRNMPARCKVKPQLPAQRAVKGKHGQGRLRDPELRIQGAGNGPFDGICITREELNTNTDFTLSLGKACAVTMLTVLLLEHWSRGEFCYLLQGT